MNIYAGSLLVVTLLVLLPVWLWATRARRRSQLYMSQEWVARHVRR